MLLVTLTAIAYAFLTKNPVNFMFFVLLHIISRIISLTYLLIEFLKNNITEDIDSKQINKFNSKLKIFYGCHIAMWLFMNHYKHILAFFITYFIVLVAIFIYFAIQATNADQIEDMKKIIRKYKK